MPTRDEIRDFSLKIEQLANTHSMQCYEAVVQHCEETGMEIDIASSLISSALKSKIREEAQNLNLLKKSAKLPV